MRRILIVLVILLSAHSVIVGQRYLVLKKKSKIIAVYEVGDEIKFQLNNEDFYYKSKIEGFTKDKIRFDALALDLDEIDKIYAPEATGRVFNILSEIGLKAGVMFFVLDQANQVVIHNEGINPSKPTLLISGSLIGSGLFFLALQKKNFKIGKKYTLEITRFKPGG